MTQQNYDLIIIGSGPIGLACAVEAQKKGLSHIVLEKGVLLDAMYRFPTNCIFFSTPELVEIGDIPFLTNGPKPTRTELLRYYTKVAEFYKLNIRLRQRVIDVLKNEHGFHVETQPESGRIANNIERKRPAERSARRDAFALLPGGSYSAKAVVLATGFFDHPNMLDVPGEELPKVTHYYTESHPYYRTKVAVIGGQNSAVEAALELYRAGAEVTLIHRHAEVGRSVKYWIKPDIENRIKEGSIKAYFNSNVREIKPDKITIQTEDQVPFEIDNDFVLAMTGYHPDFDFLRRAGVGINEDGLVPLYNPETMETETSGLYLAGIVAGGLRYANKIFIENGRIHAKYIVDDFASKHQA
ncbi:MAG: YpdA family putative bacillithiol disulfide reductase [Calditrichaeota bacterium]|nr:MAG: YpdA family putative bacillithiol disulfide reductase [Calditrichota bacterium]